jgi:hypothetical protein
MNKTITDMIVIYSNTNNLTEGMANRVIDMVSYRGRLTMPP